MEFFIPGLFLFLVSILVVFYLAPKATPMIAAILSIVFLLFGIHEHQKMFASEYRLSTWQDKLKVYAPALMIVSIILFLIYSMLAFFTGGSVPIPSMPNVQMPSVGSITESITNSLNNAANSIKNASANIMSSNKNNSANKGSMMNSILGNNNANKNKGNNKGNNVSRSFLETL